MMIVSLEIPEELASFVIDNNKEEQLKRNAMMLYPYIHDGIISHGRAAEILGMYKMDLIVLYGKLGIPYTNYFPVKNRSFRVTASFIRKDKKYAILY